MEVHTFDAEVRTFYALKKGGRQTIWAPYDNGYNSVCARRRQRASPFPSPLRRHPSLLLMRGASLSLPDAHGAASRASILFEGPQAVAARDVAEHHRVRRPTTRAADLRVEAGRERGGLELGVLALALRRRLRDAGRPLRENFGARAARAD